MNALQRFAYAYLQTKSVRMGLSFARNGARAVNAPINFSPVAMFSGMGVKTDIPPDVLLQEGIKGWPAIAARPIANRIAGLDISVFRESVDSESGDLVDMALPNHPANQIFKSNRIFTRRRLFWLVAWHLLFTGAAYLLKVRDGAGFTRQLWPIPPDRVHLIADTTEIIKGYRIIKGSGQHQDLDVEDVVRIWQPDPRNIYGDMGVVDPQATTLDAENFTDQHLRRHMEKDATPAVALTAADGTDISSPDEIESYWAYWRKAFDARRGEAVGLPAIVPPGMDIHEFSPHGGMTDLLGFLETWSKKDMAAFGTPRSVVGLSEKDNRANVETNIFVFDKFSIEPLTDLIAEDLTVQLLAIEYGEDMKFKYEDFIPKDKEFDLKREDQDLKSKVRSINMVLEDRGRESVEWGDDPVGSIADTPYRPDEAVDTEDFAPEPEPPEPEPDDDEEEEESEEPRARARKKLSVQSADAAWARVLENERKFATRFEKGMGGALDEQRRITLKHIKDLVPSREIPGRPSRAHTLSHLGQEVLKMFKVNDFNELMVLRTTKVRRATTAAGGNVGAALGGKEFAFTKGINKALGRADRVFALRVNKTTAKKLSKNIYRTLQETLDVGVEAQARAIEKAVNQTYRIRRSQARAIARTETHKAAMSSEYEGYKQSGVVEGSMWNTSRDDRVRDSHIGMDEHPMVKLDEKFTLGSGVQARYPGDPSLPAEEVINERCFLTAVTIDEV